MDIYQILRVRRDVGRDELQAKYLRMLDSYQLVAGFAESQDVRRIAKLKLDQLTAAGKEHHLYSECTANSGAVTPQTETASIKLALNSSNASGSYLKGSGVPEKVRNLPETAEKHYLSAVVTLKIDSSLEGCRAAVVEIEKALELDPANLAYRGFLDAIEEQVGEYAEQQRINAENDERARAERERRSQEALDAERRRQFLNGTGSSLQGVAGLACCICCATACCNACGGC